MKKLVLLSIICAVVLFSCADGSQLIGAYCYTPNPGTTVTIDGVTGIEIYQIDMPNVGEGYYRHYLNTSVYADGALYSYEADVPFTWAANIFDGKQDIATFTDSLNNVKTITYDPDNKNALSDENGIVYSYTQN